MAMVESNREYAIPYYYYYSLLLLLYAFPSSIHNTKAAIPGSHPELIKSLASVHISMAPLEQAGPPVAHVAPLLYLL